MKKVLLKDIVIPAGTVLHPAPVRTERCGPGHYDCVVGLSANTWGAFYYHIDPEFADELDDYFADAEQPETGGVK